MKRFRLSYLLILPALMMLASCQGNDEVTEQGGGLQPEKDGKVMVHLKVGAAGSARTRAWQDATNAETVEMMNVWTVVAVNNSDNKVASIYACKPSGEPDQEIDDYVELPSVGTYRFYSFANMSPKVVMTLLGIGGYATPTAKTARTRSAGTHYTERGNEAGGNNERVATGSVTSYVNNGTSDDDFTSENSNFAQNKFYNIPFSEGATVTADAVENLTVNVAGNNFDPAANNDFGAKGIPMSNVQTIEVTASTQTIELIVIRMMAKFELQIFNDKGSEVVIESFSLTDLTVNEDNNLKLLPSLSAAGHGSMEVTTHGDIQPNLNSTNKPHTGTMTLYPTAEQGTISAEGHKSTDAMKNPVKFTFYVNESAKPTNELKHFFLKIKLQGETEQRYVLIDDKGSTAVDDNKWDYIARNDYRIIPIVLDDYKLDIIPYDFPAIGVYPASVKEEDGLYTINFHDYGHFHLMPKVTKVSTGDAVPFAPTAPSGTYGSTSWGLVGDSFSSSWSSWTDATKITAYFNESAKTAFYRKGYSAASWTPVDGDEVGGEPQWYVNTDTNKPQWDPNASGTYNPFILGYIADPGGSLSADRKVYHEFSIYLYKQGMSAPRQMTYRLLMILDKDQMSYARQRYGRTARKTHH